MKMQVELNMMMAELFEYIKIPKKFHAIWMNQTSTCFTKHLSGQNFGKIAKGKWNNGLSQNLVEGVDMDRRIPWKSFILNEAI